jgi:CheY-like chemotaxis protein
MSFDMGELFTVAVRRVMPYLHERKLASTFDVRGPRVIVRGDPADMQRALHRLMLGLADLVRIGFVVLQANMRLTRPGKCVVEVKLAGTGLLAPRQVADGVLARLELTDDMGPGPQPPRLRRAVGTCPATGATVHYASLPAEGLLFSAEWTLPVEGVDASLPPDAHQARAWIIHGDDVAGQSLARRLQRLGWATMRFDSAAAAARRLRSLQPGQARPALVLAVECATVSPATVQALRPFLPAWTLALYTATTGSPTLARNDAVPGFELRVFPPSPMELETVTMVLSPDAELGSGTTRPMPFNFEQRPLALVADEDDGACLRTGAVLESLGYEPESVPGLERLVSLCQERAPCAVLIDLGEDDAALHEALAAARALRSREAVGACVPCVIIGTTLEHDDAQWKEARQAGFDAVLVKPVGRRELEAELRRLDIGAQLVA